MSPRTHRKAPSTASALHNQARLLISCPDRPGIVAAVSTFLFESGANIIQSDQHSTDPDDGMFFMRIEFELPDLERRFDRLTAHFSEVATRFSMEWSLTRASHLKRTAIFVSRMGHCLNELLWQWSTGTLPIDISLVISNHPDLKEQVESFGLPFHDLPVTPETKAEQEQAALELLDDRIDLIVLARYMQVLSHDFIQRYPNRIINIHHSFLPAFIGGKPYERAYERGVKIIGATAHYATEELDGGPIIEQDVQRVDHRDSISALKRIGQNIERVVLARAVHWHAEDRILVHENKTIVFA